MPQQFFYDEQIRRFLLQFTRIFSGFEVEYGRDEEGTKSLYRVPVRYGDASRQAQTIIQQNSANSLPSTPLMTFYISQLTYARNRVQDPYFVDKKNVRQRSWDSDVESYETRQANAFTIERIMPVPYNCEITLDVWTSNTNQKLQIFEQILTLFNPSLEIQSTDSFIDWTSLTVVELTGTNWSSRTIPTGTEDAIDVGTLRFELPMWITPPAKVKKLGVVEKVVAGIYDAQGNLADAVYNEDLLLGTRQKITPFGYQVLLIGNQLQALPVEAVVDGLDGVEVPQSPPSNVLWHTIIDLYGELKDGISQMRLLNKYDDSVIVGTVAYHPSDDRFLLFTIDTDTIPSNTQDPINAIVDPQRKGPGAGLPAAQEGQRYLFINDTGSDPYEGDAVAWRGSGGSPLIARANDIVEYDGSVWNVVFDADQGASQVQYVTNLTTEIQYRWADGEWLKSIEGLYPGGEWSFVP